MLRFLPGPILGIITFLLLVCSMLGVALVLLPISLIRFFIPVTSWRNKYDIFLGTVPAWWGDINRFVLWLTSGTRWNIQGKGKLDPNGWYLIIGNHQSWMDIIMLQQVFHRKAPPVKFFMKKQLLWALPIAGVVCWLLGYPFMSRHNKNYLKKHPEQKGKDLETTKKSCERFKNQPISIMNYLEGTRFTQEKHDRQLSPYQYLLKPHAGGVALVLYAMDGILHNIIDTTIIYEDNDTSLWHLLCGKIQNITVHYNVMPIPDSLVGDYYNDIEFRKRFQKQLNSIWQQKDELISNTLKKDAS